MRLPFRIASRYHSGLATKLGLSSRSQVTSAVNVKLKPSESPPTIETISVSKGNPILKVKFSDGANGSYPLAWLRDLTKESVGLSWIATELEPIRIELVSNNCGINVFWPSNKETYVEASWLRSQENLINSKQLNPDLFAKRNTRVPWGSDEVTEDPQHDLNTEFAAKDLLHNDGILSDALSKFIRCGVLRTKANDSSTSQAVLDRIGVPVEMIYRVNGDHSEADWHTGIPYTDPIPKISILQAEKNLTERSHLGSLQLIDGLKVAEKMYQTAYHHYRILCETPVNYCHTSQQKTNAAIGNSMPIFTLNQEGQMERITFNNRFRQVPTGMSSSELIKFYEALGLFYKFCQDPVNSITLSVHSGDIIVLANDRVLTKTQPKAEVCQWLSESYVTINGWDPVKPKLRDMSKGEIPL